MNASVNGGGGVYRSGAASNGSLKHCSAPRPAQRSRSFWQGPGNGSCNYGGALGDMNEIAGLRHVHLVSQHDLQLAFHHLERLGQLMVDVRRWAAIRWHHTFHHEVGPAGVGSRCEKCVHIARPQEYWPSFRRCQKRQGLSSLLNLIHPGQADYPNGVTYGTPRNI